ncbi:MAG: DUF1186 domain-containing protein [SAR324 cluster bacterium]|nr:DUF1186 domain-containing protein [SAR324 cluster bacterium]
MEFQQLIAKFIDFDGPFPKEALIESIQNRDQVIPILLKVIQTVTENDLHMIDREDYMMSSYSLYLLAQFREKKAYPAIIDFFSQSDGKAMEIVGDMFIEDIGRILASVSCGDISLLQQLIENPEAPELIRSAAVESLLVLVHIGEKSRDEIITYFKSLFNGKLERKMSLIWVSLISCCVALYPEEVLEEIEEIFDDGLVNESLIDLEMVQEVMLLNKDKALTNFFEGSYYSLIEDVIKEMADHAEAAI